MTDNSQHSPFHAGERAVQQRVGVVQNSDHMIYDHIPQQHRDFYHQLPYVFVGHSDKKGLPWASILYKDAGLLTTPDDKTLSINALPVHGDPLGEGLTVGSRLGVLGLDMPSGIRNRLSGQVTASTDQGLTLAVEQAFSNGSKYIKTRQASPVDREPLKLENISYFDNRAKQLIKHSNTFFVASYSDSGDDSPTNGADISHRGGEIGFVRIDDDNTLTIADYSGNGYFNTLGNFERNPRAGLLFVDFNNGHIMSVTGNVEVLWDSPELEQFAGAERLWRFTIKYGRWISHALPFQWQEK